MGRRPLSFHPQSPQEVLGVSRLLLQPLPLEAEAGLEERKSSVPSLEVGLWGRPRSELSFLNQAPWSELVTPSYLYRKYIQCREKGGLNSMILSCSPLVHPYPLAWGAVLFQKGLVGMKGKGHVQRQVGLGDRIPGWLLHLCFWSLCAL